MRRAVLLSLMVVLALPMGVGAAPTGANSTISSVAPADVAVLTLDGSARSSFATESLDVATAVAVQREVAAARLERHTLEGRFESNSSTDARQRLLIGTLTSIENRIDELYAQERQLRTAYGNRSITTEAFVRGLARLDGRPGTLRETLGRVEVLADRVPQFPIGGRIDRLDSALIGFEGQLRQRALAAVRGDAPSTRLYVDVSGDGIVLATIEDGRHIREAYRADNRDEETADSIGFSDAVILTESLYAPYAFNDTLTSGNNFRGPISGMYRLAMEMSEGSVIAYLDGSTRRIFYEVQERRLALYESPVTVEGAANGTRLVANRTFAGGPLRLAVYDNESGEPLAATLKVDGRTIPTGPDGVAWTLAPRLPVEVTAVGPSGNVTLSVRPLPPTPVHGSEG